MFMNLPVPQTGAERFALILDMLGRAVAARIAGGAMQAAMIVLVWTRLRRIDGRMQALMRRFLAGRLVVLTRKRVGGSGGGGGVNRADGGGGVESNVGRAVSGRLPRGFGWLLPMVPHVAACYAGQLRTVLAEPEMVALLQAAPQARRLLGPLCRMLGVEPSVLGTGSVPGGGVEVVTGEVAPAVGKRVRAARAKVDLGRIPLPRGVLSAARRQGFGKR
jgi:hypothetical protein